MTREAPEVFRPVHLDPRDLEDLAAFTGLSQEACRKRLEEYSVEEMAQRWREADPRTPEQILEFYRNAEPYLWELLQWHASEHRIPYHQAVEFAAGAAPSSGQGPRRALEFGCGVGTDSLRLAEAGFSVTLMDVDGPASRFARFRLERRGLEYEFNESTSMVPRISGPFHVLVCFDVLEHMPEPLILARRMVASLVAGGLLVERSTFGDEEDHPCHLASGVARYSHGRWEKHLAGLGTSVAAPMVRRRLSGARALIQKARAGVWRATGLWV